MTMGGVAAEPGELGVETASGVGLGEPVDPFRRGGGQHPVAGLAAADGDPVGEVGLACSGWAEEHDVLSGLDEVEGAEVGR